MVAGVVMSQPSQITASSSETVVDFEISSPRSALCVRELLSPSARFGLAELLTKQHRVAGEDI